MVVMETYIFLKDRPDNKWSSLKNFDFSNRTNKVRQREYCRSKYSTILYYSYNVYLSHMSTHILFQGSMLRSCTMSIIGAKHLISQRTNSVSMRERPSLYIL